MDTITLKDALAFNFYEKTWRPEFSQSCVPKERHTFLEAVRLHPDQHPNAANDLRLFWEGSQLPRPEIQHIQDYCCDASLPYLESGTGEAGQRHAAWLDEREIRGGARTHKERLTASELFHRLKEKRFNHASLPKADRRLIFISDLDPSYILALAETATPHQVHALRQVIWNHLALRTSLQVQIPTRGYPTFQLEFNLPYFLLRGPAPKVSHGLTLKPTRPGRFWTNLSFLHPSTTESVTHLPNTLMEAHFSFVICGSSNNFWTAYAFVDSCIDSGEKEDERDFKKNDADDDNDDDDDDDSIVSDELGTLREDPILANGEYAGIDRPIEDPREYFLHVFESRMSQLLREWQTVVTTLERSILGREWENQPSSMREEFEWTLKTIGLMESLIETLSTTIRAWERFSALGGDIAYFSQHHTSSKRAFHTRLLLTAIKSKFEQLEELKQTMLMLQRRCKHTADQLKLRLAVEGSEAVKRNETSVSFTVQFISPLAISTLFFAMETRPTISDSLKTSIIAFFITFLVIQVTHSLFKVNRSSHFIHKIFATLRQCAKVLTLELQALRNESYRRLATDATSSSGQRQHTSEYELQNSSRQSLSIGMGITSHQWTCHCGHTIYDEYRHIKGQNALIKLSMDLPNFHSRFNSSAPIDADTVLLSHFRKSVQTFLRRLWASSGPPLPQYVLRQPSSIQCRADEISPNSLERCELVSNSTDHIYLLLGVPTKKGATKIHQNDVCQIKSDREFFQLVRSTYESQRGRALPAMSLKKVNALYFAKFEVYYDNIVARIEIDSVPPENLNDEYTFNATLADAVPPIGPNMMLHFYENPKDVSQHSSKLYERIPKKLRTKLSVSSTDDHARVEGWGILITEGFNWSIFFLYSILAFFACLVCGTVYAILRDDIQGGFALAGLLFAFTVFCGGLLHTSVNS